MNDPVQRQLPDLSTDQQGAVDAPQRLLSQFLPRLVVGQTLGVAFLTVMVTLGGLVTQRSQLFALLPLGAIAVVVGLVAYGLLRRNQVRAGGYIFFLGTSVAITANVLVRGYQDASIMYYLWPILGGIMIMEAGDGLVVALGSGGLFLSVVILQQLGYQVPPLPFDFQEEGLLTAGSAVMMFFLLGLLARLASQTLGRAIQSTRRYSDELEKQREQLEQTVVQRTRELVRRSNYLEATTTVAREAASMLNLQQLLTQVTRLISERFDCYHIGIFMLDSTQQWAELQAASSEGGQKMLARNHRLRVGSQGIVGYVTEHGVPRIALDVGTDAVFFDNPDLPETRSEVALPLQARGEIIGAVDMQSTEPLAFGEEDIAVLQTLADQIALAINNARLFEQAQAAVEIERRAAGEIAGQAWQNLLRSQAKTLAYIRRSDGLKMADATFQPAALPFTGKPTPVQDEPTRLIVPIKVRDQVVGVIDANQPEGEWTPERVALVETLTEQLGVALESARLYQDTQRRAARERAIREISDEMQRATDMDSLLRIAAEALNRTLHSSRVYVSLEESEQPEAGDLEMGEGES